MDKPFDDSTGWPEVAACSTAPSKVSGGAGVVP